MTASALLAEVAARYGATVAPGATVTVLRARAAEDHAPMPVKRRGRPPKLLVVEGRAVAAETLDQKKVRRAAKKVAKVRDRRRFKITPVPGASKGRIADPDATGTIFPNQVREIGTDPVLKDGASNSKIGGDVLVGRLKGAKVFTLTLEERTTCPRSCGLWLTCYGNSMQYSVRWRHGPALEARLAEEVAALCAAHETVLIRLHVLGDFYSADYVALWASLLARHSGLHIFGFTAHPPKSEIGAAIAMLRQLQGNRFAIRHSGQCSDWGSFTIDFPTDRPRIGNAVVCPEQRDAMNGKHGMHCGSCGLCWANSAPVVFVEH